MTLAISKLSPCRDRVGSPMLRYTITLVDAADPNISVTKNGCIAGNNSRGAWALPKQDAYHTETWSAEFERQVLRALEAAGALEGLKRDAVAWPK